MGIENIVENVCISFLNNKTKATFVSLLSYLKDPNHVIGRINLSSSTGNFPNHQFSSDF